MERRRLLILLLLTMIGAVAFGQLKRYDADFVLSKKNYLTTIPIEIERGQIYLSVDINGKTFRFKLDTGASRGGIYDDVELEGVKELGFIRSEDAIGQSQQVKTVELPPFRINSLYTPFVHVTFFIDRHITVRISTLQILTGKT